MPDDTYYLQNQIDAHNPGDTFVLDARRYNLMSSVFCRQGVSLEPNPLGGTEIFKDPGAENGSVLRLNDVGDLTIKSVPINGNAKNRTWYEHDHLISCKGARNVKIEENLLVDSCGDGVYLGSYDDPVTGEHRICDDVTVRRNRFRGGNRGRQAVSFIGGRGLKVLDNWIFRYTRDKSPAGVTMPGFLDFEPNVQADTLEDCLVEGNHLWNFSTVRVNAAVMFYNNAAQALLNGVTVRENSIAGNFSSVFTVRSWAGGEIIDFIRNGLSALPSYAGKFTAPDAESIRVHLNELHKCALASPWLVDPGTVVDFHDNPRT